MRWEGGPTPHTPDGGGGKRNDDGPRQQRKLGAQEERCRTYVDRTPDRFSSDPVHCAVEHWRAGSHWVMLLLACDRLDHALSATGAVFGGRRQRRAFDKCIDVCPLRVPFHGFDFDF